MPAVDGPRLRELRQRSGQKVGAFATAVGISRGHLVNLERSARPASIEVLYRMAGALGVEINELTSESTRPAP